jgi:catechol 2,3-dioxygenase-like lactoylglutathione lyase family enzyme
MLPAITGFDHLVILVRDIDRAAAMYQALGFTLTERGHHSRGTCNHTMMLDGNYMELVTVEHPGPGNAEYVELLKRREGPQAIGLQTGDADAVHAQLAAMGIETAPAIQFSRPVQLPGGARDATFRATRVPKQADLPELFACQHLTRDVVWRPEWQGHANGAQRVIGVVIGHGAPDRAATAWRGLFGGDGGSLGATRVEFVAPDGIAARFPGTGVPATADGALVGVVLAVRSAAETAALLRQAGIPTAVTAAGGVVPDPAVSGGAVLEFRAG